LAASPADAEPEEAQKQGSSSMTISIIGTITDRLGQAMYISTG
jgi:hypothetical protein